MSANTDENFLPHDNRSIGQILLDSDIITLHDAERILHYQRGNSVRFGEAALKLNLIDEGDLRFALSRQFSYPYLRNNEGEYGNELIAAYKPFDAQVEILRGIRSNLILRWFSETQRTLAMISTERGEGRSYIAANLAVVFSQLGESTLLVDADLRNPRQHEIFTARNEFGLSSWLAGRGESPEIVSIPHFSNLDVLPAGPIPPNPQELLTSSRFAKLVGALPKRYEVILFDTPASELYTDAALISARVGGALLVARKHQTRVKVAKSVSERLEEVGSTIVGSVLNNF